MADYPIPDYAAYIWVAGDKVWIGFPPLGDLVQAHSVPFPATDKGLALLIRTLKERNQGLRHLGTNGSPTRYAVERELVNDRKYNGILKAMHAAKEKQAEEDAAATEFLKDLGLL